MPESSREEIAKLEALYANNPDGRIFTHLAEALRRAGELDRARTILEQGITKHPTYASAHVVLGRVLMDQQQPEEATEAFRRVLSLDPHNLIALRSLGDMARAAGRNEEAIGYFEQLRHHDPNNTEIDAIIAELAAPPAQTAEAAAAEPTPETAEEWASPAPADAAPAEAEQPAEVVSDNVDLNWIPDFGEESEGLPGDLGSLAASSTAPSEPELPTFDMPDNIGEISLGEPEPEEEPAGVTFEDFNFEAALGQEPEPEMATDEGTFDLPTFEEPAPTEATFEEPVFEETGFEMPTFEPAAVEPPAFEPPASEPPSFEPPSFEPPSFEPPAAIEPGAPEAAQAEPEAHAEEASGEVVTETIAELYTSQGLHDRAAEVYRTLLQQRPDDPTLQARLAEAESRAAAPPFEPTAPEAIHPPAAFVEASHEEEGWLAGGAGTAESAPTPYAWAERGSEIAEADTSPPISNYFRDLLAWRPSRPAAPAAIAPVPPVVTQPAAAPAPVAEEEDALLLLEEQAPPSQPEPWEPPAAVAPPEPTPPLTAATVIEPEPMPWEEPAAPAAPAAATPSSATTAEDAFDEWFGTEEPAEAAASAPEPEAPQAPAEGEGTGEDDDDLEMFRSWLQSLKK